jgi:hypothetical protein
MLGVTILEGTGMGGPSLMNSFDHRQSLREKPTLTDEQLQIIAAVVAESYRQESAATFEVFDPFKPKETRGVVTKVDQQLRQFRIGQLEWMRFSEVMTAKFDNTD